jgi:hypothetical protein
LFYCINNNKKPVTAIVLRSHVESTDRVSGIELVQKIKKGQFNIPKSIDDREARTPQVWEAVLAA